MPNQPETHNDPRHGAAARDAQSLVLINDNVNTFGHVIATLVDLLGHTPTQAEQCAVITHHNGRCQVDRGSRAELEAKRDALRRQNLRADIVAE